MVWGLIGAGLGVSAIGGVVSSIIGSSASAEASEAAIAASERALQMQLNAQEQAYDNSLRMLGPIIQTQYAANNAFLDLLGLPNVAPGQVPAIVGSQGQVIRPGLGADGQLITQSGFRDEQGNLIADVNVRARGGPPGSPAVDVPASGPGGSFGGYDATNPPPGDGPRGTPLGPDGPSSTLPPPPSQDVPAPAPDRGYGGGGYGLGGAYGERGGGRSAYSTIDPSVNQLGLMPAESVLTAGPPGAQQIDGAAPLAINTAGSPTPEEQAAIDAAAGNAFRRPPPTSSAAPTAGQPAPTSGAFVDPNLDQRRFGRADYRDTELGAFSDQNTLAAAVPEVDAVVRRAADTALFGGIDADTMVQQARGSRLAGATMADDAIYQDIASRQRLGNTFEASPGYAFAQEEAQRAGERALSRGGGGVGGRAALELSRRSQGVAQQEYYNWLGARMAEDQRLDQAAYQFGDRQRFDIGREDLAVADARRREELDLSRGDAALQDYNRRRAEDLSVQRQAILNNQQLGLFDQQRQDQSYYNRLNSLAQAAGIGSMPVNQTAQATNVLGQDMGSAYAQQGAVAAQTGGNAALAQGQIWGNFAQNLGNTIGQGLAYGAFAGQPGAGMGPTQISTQAPFAYNAFYPGMA